MRNFIHSLQFLFPNIYFGLKTKHYKNHFKKVADIRKEIEDTYFKKCGVKLNLDNPSTIYDKINYLRLNENYEDSWKYVDKLEAKKIARKHDSNIKIAKVIASFSSFKEFKNGIKNLTLPNRFVVKLNNGNGSIFVNFNDVWQNKYGKKVSKHYVYSYLKHGIKLNFYYVNFEKCYDKVEPKIFIEEYLGDSIIGIPEYKVFYNYGVPKLLNVVYGRQSNGKTIEAFLDMSLKKLDMHQKVEILEEKDIIIPKCWDKILEFGKKASEGFPILRVDVLSDGDNYYFCEFTFYDCGGNAVFVPLESNKTLGEMFNISK